MSALDDIIGNLPVDQLAQQLGTDPTTVRQAAVPAVTSLLGGMTQNAQEPAGELSLAEALNQHATRDLGGEQVNLGAVDPAEGEKILGHVFGNQTDGVAQALAGQSGMQSDLVRRLLPMLAPIVLAYLGKQLMNGQAGGVLGQVLGGAVNAPGQQSAGQGMLGGVLSQVLGHVLGGSAAPAGNPFDASTAQATQQQAQAQGGDIVSQILGGLLSGKR